MLDLNIENAVKMTRNSSSFTRPHAFKTPLFLLWNIKLAECCYFFCTRTIPGTQSWSELLALLVNMIKEDCENVSVLLILLIFDLKNSQKSNHV